MSTVKVGREAMREIWRQRTANAPKMAKVSDNEKAA
jgi:hypothetical protein